MRKTKRKLSSPKLLKRPKNLKSGDLIEIYWDDHRTRAGWAQDVMENADPILCKSVGYFIGFAAQGDIVLAGSFAGEGSADDANGVMYRLWSAVRKIRRLR